jgi:hypothetical protein
MVPSELLFIMVGMVGVILLFVALRPRRKGNSLHCRKCEYDLTGNTSGRCPECGSELTGRAVAIALLAICGGGLYSKATELNFYKYKPSSWIIDDATSSIQAVSDRAWNEITWRLGTGRFSESAKAKLTEVALVEQGKPTMGPNAEQFLDFLGQRIKDGKLDEKQKKRFLDQCVKLRSITRPQTVMGEPILVLHIFECRVPQDIYVRFAKEIFYRVGETAGTEETGVSSVVGVGPFEHYWQDHIPAAWFGRPGKYVLESELEIAVGEDPDGSPVQVGRKSYPLCPLDKLQSRTDVQIVEPSEEYLKPIIDPLLADEIRKITNIRAVKYGKSLDITFKFERPSVNLAFEVFIRKPNGELPGQPNGRIIARKGVLLSHGGPHVDASFVSPSGTIDLVFRSSSKVATDTVDIFEYWEGTLEFKDIPVETRK